MTLAYLRKFAPVSNYEFDVKITKFNMTGPISWLTIRYLRSNFIKLPIVGFSRFLNINMKLKIQNLLYETLYLRVFELSHTETEVEIIETKIADSI